jgi:hypothetical protein
MTELEQIASDYEVTCDYIMDEFVIDDELHSCDTFFAIIDDCPMVLMFEDPCANSKGGTVSDPWA